MLRMRLNSGAFSLGSATSIRSFSPGSSVRRGDEDRRTQAASALKINPEAGPESHPYANCGSVLEVRLLKERALPFLLSNASLHHLVSRPALGRRARRSCTVRRKSLRSSPAS
jgi:hypothetical protein